jgi:hypothetical protein
MTQAINKPIDSDFRIYRQSKNQVISVIMPE